VLAEFLSFDEQARAARYRFARDQEHFILARGLLREILYRYLAIQPGQIRFSYGPYGKPALAGVQSDLRFNVAHAADVALYAFTRGHELGVDVEHAGHLRSQIEYEQIARSFFSPSEVATLLALPATTRRAAFYRCWTIKEAYIKGLGGGLSIPLDHFDVALTPGTPAAILATRPDPTQADRWAITLLDPGPGYTGALAVEDRMARLTCLSAEL
jgi:4'-phosphopantetheinyl transferase